MSYRKEKSEYDPIYFLVTNPFDPRDIYWLRKCIFSARPYYKNGVYVTILEQFCSLREDQMHDLLASASSRIQNIMWTAWRRHNERLRDRQEFKINQESSWHLEKLFEFES